MAAVGWDHTAAVEQTQTGRREKDEALTLHMTPISHERLGANLGSSFCYSSGTRSIPLSSSWSEGERPGDHASHLLPLAGNEKQHVLNIPEVALIGPQFNVINTLNFGLVSESSLLKIVERPHP